MAAVDVVEAEAAALDVAAPDVLAELAAAVVTATDEVEAVVAVAAAPATEVATAGRLATKAFATSWAQGQSVLRTTRDEPCRKRSGYRRQLWQRMNNQ